ncbi:hypothetical protein [Sphingobium sp. MK2]|uniref:hypothetical protein n=1 Tax=Sphingobium sp. MK2 TaxID=3116540 RepID=UPI0032E35960
MHKTPVLALLLLSLAPFPATAQGRCPSSDVVVVDRSRFAPTIERARTVVRAKGRGSTPVPYAEGSDLDSFAERVAAFHPKVVIVHYSMFRPGHPARGRVTAKFLAALQSQATPPERIILYSSSLYDGALNPRGRTLAQLRTEGFFAGLTDARVSLIHVNDGARFTAKNGATALGAIIVGLGPRGACSS